MRSFKTYQGFKGTLFFVIPIVYPIKNIFLLSMDYGLLGVERLLGVNPTLITLINLVEDSWV